MENGHWYTDKNGNHYFVKDGESPKEGWERSKRRKMIDDGKYYGDEGDGKGRREMSKEEYDKYEADDEFDMTTDDDLGFDEEEDSKNDDNRISESDEKPRYETLDDLLDDDENYDRVYEMFEKRGWDGDERKEEKGWEKLQNNVEKLVDEGMDVNDAFEQVLKEMSEGKRSRKKTVDELDGFAKKYPNIFTNGEWNGTFSKELIMDNSHLSEKQADILANRLNSDDTTASGFKTLGEFLRSSVADFDEMMDEEEASSDSIGDLAGKYGMSIGGKHFVTDPEDDTHYKMLISPKDRDTVKAELESMGAEDIQFEDYGSDMLKLDFFSPVQEKQETLVNTKIEEQVKDGVTEDDVGYIRNVLQDIPAMNQLTNEQIRRIISTIRNRK